MAAVVVLAALPGAGVLAQGPPRLDQIVQSYVGSGRFMGAVLVARGDEILLSKGYGQANLEWTIPNTPSTKFRLGSLTKQFTAASILLLAERGALNLQAPVKTYVPDAPASWDGITLVHLLSHTSGIPNFTSDPSYATWKFHATTARDLVARFRDKPLDFAPGEKWSYSNSGYAVLGYVIEKVTGGTYERFVVDNIFRPLGMKDSGYDSNTAIVAHRAAGYAPGPNGPVNAPFINMTVPFSAGGLYSTAEDLLRWEQGLFGGKVLSSASLQRMTTAVRNDYGFGVRVHVVNGRDVVEHNGGIEGFNTYLAYYPSARITVAVLANLNGPAADQMGPQLGAAANGDAVTLASERTEIALSTAQLMAYVGTYELRPGFDLAVTLEGDHLMSQATGQGKFQLFAESPSRFFVRALDAQIEFVRVATGAVTHLVLHQNGADVKAPRK
jgi:CubicO group peptidase (beta-lactamase class C family)